MKNMKKDKLLRGLMADKNVQFYAISGRELVKEAKRIHDTSATCTAALGRSLMGTAILEAMEKGEQDQVSFIIKGDGPSGNIVCVGRKEGGSILVKGDIVNPQTELPPRATGKLDVGGAVGHQGTLTIIRDSGMKEPYIGRSDLVSGEIAEDLGQYFVTSQQTPSIVYLGVHIDRNFDVSAAGGIIIQLLPGCDDSVIDEMEALAPRLGTLVSQLEENDDLQAVLETLLVEQKPEFLEETPVAFSCDCSRTRVESALIALGAEEIQSMIAQDDGAELTCHFCRKKYHFTGDELGNLLAGAQKRD